MVQSESGWDPNAAGDFDKKKGIYCSWGLVQINLCAHAEVTQTKATDPTFALEYAARALEAGTAENDWTSCNCYSLVWTKIGHLPLMSDIQPNAEPLQGSVAIFYYHDRQTGERVKHVAYVTGVARGNVTIQEANKEPCLIDTRVIHVGDPALAGFWSPNGV